MMPGLIPGDFILVKKYSYGIRLPVINKKIIELGRPSRGDIVVFRYPQDESVNYIKRAIGLPGDKVVYTNKTLYINDNQIPQYGMKPEMMRDSSHHLTQMRRLTENLEGVEHSIYVDPSSSQETLQFVVPDNQYFVMGDNRDRSNDSRYWGFVPDQNIVGRAFLVWLSWDRQSDSGWFWSRILWGRIGISII
jgi:signal peptidase I